MKSTRLKPRHLFRTSGLTLASLVATQLLNSRAADIHWNGSSSADYNNAANWSPAGVPGATDNAINDNGTGNQVQINIGDPDWTVGQIRAGNSIGNGAFVQNGQTVTALGTNYNGSVISEFFTPFRLGIVAADSGAYTLNGGTLNFGTGPFHVGEVGTGTLNLNGGTITGSGVFSVNSGGIAVPNPAVITGTAGHGPYLGDFTYYEQGYSATHPTTGLPAAGSTIASVTQPDHSYRFAPTYTANDAIILDAAVPSATITLTTPTACSGLSFMGSAGNGPVVVNYTVNYASGAPDTGSLSVPDWFGSGQEVLNVEGRVDGTGVILQYPGTAGGNPVGNAPYLLSTDIALVNTAKVLSINLTYVSGGGSFATATLLAVSGQDIVGNPFTPLAVTGYNADVVVEAAAPSPIVSASVMDTVTQTGGTNTINQLWVAQGPTAHGTYNLSNGEIDVNDWTVIGRAGGIGMFNMTGGTINKANGGNFIIGSGAGDNATTGYGTFNQSGGTINDANEYWVAENTLTTGTNNISGTAVLNLNNWMSIGRGGSAVVNVSGSASVNKNNNGNFIVGDNGNAVVNQSGGTNTVNSELWVANGGTSTGIYNMSGGVLNAHNWFQVGRGGAALLNFTGGTINKDNNGAFIIGDNATVSARVIQTGAGAVFNCANDYWIANNTTGELDFTNSVLSANTLIAGNNGICQFFQSGGTVTANSEFWVGQGTSTGAYELSGGGTISVTSWISIGRNGGNGTVNLLAGAINKGPVGNFSIGGDGGATGVLNQSAGTITNLLGNTYLGQGGGNGTWNMDGGSANLVLLQFCEGGNGSGVLNLNAGVIRATEVNSGIVGVPGNSTLNFNGGTLQAAGNNTNFLHDIATVNVGSDAMIDSQSYHITIPQNLPNGGGNTAGGLTKTGTGTLLLDGNNTYTGATTVSAGTLGGTGTFAGPVTVNAGATFAPGAAIGTITIDNTLTLSAGSTTVMEISKTAHTNDLVTGTGNTIAYGGTLVLKNLSGVLQPADTFTLFAAGTRSGSFSSVVSQTPGQTVTWDVSQLTVNGTVKVASALSAPVTLVSAVSGGTLNLSWPANQIGWQLQHQVNPLTVGISTNWVAVPGSTATNQVGLPLDGAEPSEFFRLVFPPQ